MAALIGVGLFVVGRSLWQWFSARRWVVLDASEELNHRKWMIKVRRGRGVNRLPRTARDIEVHPLCPRCSKPGAVMSSYEYSSESLGYRCAFHPKATFTMDKTVIRAFENRICEDLRSGARRRNGKLRAPG